MGNKKTYDFILEECFKLFLQKGYKDVTIVDIEKAIGMTRGAVFYYVKDKQALFNAVIERFIFEKQNVNNKVHINPNDTLLEFIKKYVEGIKQTMSVIKSIQSENVLKSYLNLTFTALTYYESFNQRATFFLNLDRKTWEMFLEKSVNEKEINSKINIEQTAFTFQALFYGYAYIHAISDDFNADDLLSIYANFYSQIKI